MLSKVQDEVESSQPFSVTTGVKQGCVMASTLFTIFFSKLRDGFDGKLFSLWKLQAKTKVQIDVIPDLFFTDHCTLNAGTYSEMQDSLDLFSAAFKYFGLPKSTKKTEAMINLLLLYLTQSPPSQWAENSLLWHVSSPTFAAPYHDQLPSMKKAATELHVQMLPLADYMPVCGK